jgi:hypothetical protein
MTDREKIARILFACGWGDDTWEVAVRRGVEFDYWYKRADAILERFDVTDKH